MLVKRMAKKLSEKLLTYRGDVESIRRLILEVDVNAQLTWGHDTAPHIAAVNGIPMVVKFLLKKNI